MFSYFFIFNERIISILRNLPNAIPSSSTGYYHHQIPHPSVYAPRYSPGSLTSSSDYPPQGVYVGAPRLPQQVNLYFLVISS